MSISDIALLSALDLILILSKALSIYFETGHYEILVKEVNLIRQDIKIIIDL